MTDDQLKACEASAPFMVAEYRKLEKKYTLACKLVEEQAININSKEEEIKKLKAFISRLMWPNYTEHDLLSGLIVDAAAMGWTPRGWESK